METFPFVLVSLSLYGSDAATRASNSKQSTQIRAQKLRSRHFFPSFVWPGSDLSTVRIHQHRSGRTISLIDQVLKNKNKKQVGLLLGDEEK